jgi:membrane associated rhomboid family serine protease
VAVVVGLMWVLELVDFVFGHRLDQYGIVSRSVAGLPGVLFSPFLHLGFGHLAANTVPFVILGALVSWRSGNRFYVVFALITVLGGFGVWLLGPSNTVTIGASGVVFGFLGYLLTRGVLTRHWLDVLVSVAVFLFYGALLWGATPFGVSAGVSWLAHLTGFVAGIATAFVVPRRANEPSD